MTEYAPLSPDLSDDMGSMIEPMYEDDIETIIHQVNADDVQHFDNERFVRIKEDEMPQILQFLDENDQFSDWAIIGETRGEDEESIPGSSEDTENAEKKPPQQQAPQFCDVDGLEQLAEDAPEEEEEEEESPANENENSMVFSMFLSNWEDQVRQIREAKRLEWESKMKTLLGDEHEGDKGPEQQTKEFVDEDGDSWVLLDSNDAKATSNDHQVAVVDGNNAQVARRTGFFEEWPSFNVGSKLGVVLAATGTSFCFGFMMGARAAMDSFYRLCERPLVAGVVGVTTAFAVSIQPTMLVTAVKYIILGGVVGGTAVATPVFVVGTTGVFVSAAVYHAWIVAKRGVVRAVTSPSSRSPPASQSASPKRSAIAGVPLSSIQVVAPAGGSEPSAPAVEVVVVSSSGGKRAC
jgi:hypothetical protein